MLHTWSHQDTHKPSSCITFMLNPHWGRAITIKKSLACMYVGSLWSCPTLCDSEDCNLPGFSVRESRQEYWSVLANTVCNTFLEHYIIAAVATNSPEYLVQPEPL